MRVRATSILGLSGWLVVCLPLAAAAQAAVEASSVDHLTSGFRLLASDRPDAAVAEFERVLAAASDGDASHEADAWRGIAVAHYRRGRYDASRLAIERARAIFERLNDQLGLARVNRQLGTLAYVAGDSAGARRLYENALATFEASGTDSDRAGTLKDLTFAIGLMDPAIDGVIARGLAAAKRAGEARTEGDLQHTLGDLRYVRGDFAGALVSLREAAAILERAHAARNLSTVYVSFGRLYRLHGQPAVALTYYRRALAFQRATGDRLAEAQSLNAISLAYSAMDRPAAAIRELQRAIAICVAIGAASAEHLYRSNLANMYLDLGQPARALPILLRLADETRIPANAARANLRLARAYNDLKRYPEALAATDRAIAAEALEAENLPAIWQNRAQALERLDRHAEALAAVRSSMDAVEALRRRLIPVDFLKQGYGETLQGLFANQVRLLHRMGQDREALESAERARARAFLDVLALRTGDQERFATSASIEQMATMARELGSVIVSYWVGSAETLIWVTDPDGRVKTASARVSARRLAELVNRTSANLDSLSPDRAPLDSWRELYRLLVRPVEQSLPTTRGSLLTIVPHGPLFRLSFAALVDERQTYLIERYSLHYVPSAGSLLYLKSHSTDTTDPIAYLLVGDPAAPSTLPSLPGASREVRAIARVLPPRQTTVLTGNAASEEQVRRAFTGQGVIHLATHGLLRDDKPLESYLVFGGKGREPERDGRLTASDIYSLALQADLVVLSACRSGRGRVTGDGVLGMTRAFMAAGTPTVVATLWDVADQPAADLMPVFYRSWQSGETKSGALRRAQLALLARLRAGRIQDHGRTLSEHPFFWAGFVLLGKP